MGNMLAVDADKRKELIRQRKKSGGSGLKAGLFLYGFFIGLNVLVLVFSVAFMLCQVIEAWEKGYQEDLFALIALAVLSPIPAAIFLLIPAGIKRYIYGKLLWPTAVYRKETVRLYGKTLEHGYYSIKEGSSYWTRTVRYCDIQRLEYHRKEGYLRVCAPTEDREWADQNRVRCYSSFSSRTDETGESYLSLNSYFEGFWDMVKLLEERSGLRLEEV